MEDVHISSYANFTSKGKTTDIKPSVITCMQKYLGDGVLMTVIYLAVSYLKRGSLLGG